MFQHSVYEQGSHPRPAAFNLTIWLGRRRSPDEIQQRGDSRAGAVEGPVLDDGHEGVVEVLRCEVLHGRDRVPGPSVQARAQALEPGFRDRLSRKYR